MGHSYVNTHIDTVLFPIALTIVKYLWLASLKKVHSKVLEKKKTIKICHPLIQMLKCIADLRPKTLPQSLQGHPGLPHR